MADTLVWTDIPVENLDRAISFYSTVLGKPVQKLNVGCEFGLLPHEQNKPGGCLVIDDTVKPSAHGPLIYLSVEGRLKAATEKARELGSKVIHEPHKIGPHGYRSVIIDSEGNRIALHSRIDA